jgi:hypothetical protein
MLKSEQIRMVNYLMLGANAVGIKLTKTQLKQVERFKGAKNDT